MSAKTRADLAGLIFVAGLLLWRRHHRHLHRWHGGHPWHHWPGHWPVR
ncbi:MAG: hypothetical protein M0Z69_01155 [Actinomycetota bacterium]|jgi:hypothetical protein|nr:hypothetical protein [Actinomycetota bacterium]